jgi:ribosomal protein S18 acetylase RimI-like enzyme
MENIREAKKEELKEVYGLYLLLLKSYPEAFVDSYDIESKKEMSEWVEHIKRTNTKIFVIEEDDELIGIAEIELGLSHIEIPLLSKMGVLPGFRDKGLGVKLLNFCFKYLKDNDYSELKLFVLANMNKTVSFYTKNGFSIAETLEKDILHKYDDSWKDVYIMSKSLQ